MRLLILCCCAWVAYFVTVHATLRLEVHNASFDIYDEDQFLLFHSDEISFYYHNRWCFAGQDFQWITRNTTNHQNGDDDPNLGPLHRTIILDWHCDDVRIRTSIATYDRAILFQTQWPDGIAMFDTDTPDPDDSRMHFPSLTSFLPHVLSWQGSFMRGIHTISTGSKGGPVVFYNDTLDRIIVVSPFRDGQSNYKSYTSGRTNASYAPGISGRIRSFPTNYSQTILLYQSRPNTGMVGGLYEWGALMQHTAPNKLYDVTLDTIGYQTDNGAYYCFCHEHNCSQVLSDVVHSLDRISYLSFQGDGASSGRGRAAPWCVSTWGVDGGLGPMYPVPMKEFQRVLGIPLQLYIPYFCPDSPYFHQTKWKSVASDTTLPGCKLYDFINVHPFQSLEFYRELFDRGVKVGMQSFESDFMNQNYNCVPTFVSDTSSAALWMTGMGNAAGERNITVQWCYATPSDVLMSIQFPSVTQFRVSQDFCYGTSWDIGLSSLLVGALGAAPSKDTLWTTVNNRVAIPGCPWTRDHEAMRLHALLALLSTGPVGISDAYGSTDRSLLYPMMNSAGRLLKPSRAIAAVDSTFVDPFLKSEDNGYVYGTNMEGVSWIFVSFMLKRPYTLHWQRDFWPAVSSDTVLILQNAMPTGSVDCTNRVQRISIDDSIQLPAASFVNVTAASDMIPDMTYIWTPCPVWTLLGELDKYVPLSPQRFTNIECHTDGVIANVSGSYGEIVHVTAVSNTDCCVTKHVVILKDGKASVEFTDASNVSQ